MKMWLSPLALSFLTLATAQAAPPVVSNVRAAQLAGTKNVEILYDVSDADNGTLTIGVEMSGDGGATYTSPATALSGNVGAGVTPSANRRIVWNAGADWNNQSVPNARARVTAFDGTSAVVFFDAFIGNSINTSKWITSGNSVTQSSGVMNVITTVTDAGGNLVSTPFVISRGHSLRISRRVKLHYSNSYCLPQFINPAIRQNLHAA